MSRSESAHPICYLAVANDQTRTSLETELVRLGWHVITKPTGIDLVADLAGGILGDQPVDVDLVVVEDKLPGCRGSSIARGLAELGVGIPVAVIDSQPAELAEAERLFVFDPMLATVGVSAIAQHGMRLAS